MGSFWAALVALRSLNPSVRRYFRTNESEHLNWVPSDAIWMKRWGVPCSINVTMIPRIVMRLRATPLSRNASRRLLILSRMSRYDSYKVSRFNELRLLGLKRITYQYSSSSWVPTWWISCCSSSQYCFTPFRNAIVLGSPINPTAYDLLSEVCEACWVHTLSLSQDHAWLPQLARTNSGCFYLRPEKRCKPVDPFWLLLIINTLAALRFSFCPSVLIILTARMRVFCNNMGSEIGCFVVFFKMFLDARLVTWTSQHIIHWLTRFWPGFQPLATFRSWTFSRCSCCCSRSWALCQSFFMAVIRSSSSSRRSLVVLSSSKPWWSRSVFSSIDSWLQKCKSVPISGLTCFVVLCVAIPNTSFSFDDDSDDDLVAADGNRSCGDGRSTMSSNSLHTRFFWGLLAGVGASGWPFERFIFWDLP